MSRRDLVALVAGLVAAVVAIVAPVAIVSHHSTERLLACVGAGGAYVAVPNTTQMECVR